MVGVDPTTSDLVTNRVYQWDPRDDVFTNLGRSYVLESIMDITGYSEQQIKEELSNRATVLRAMVKTKQRSFEEISNVITEYYGDPLATLAKYKKLLKADASF